MGLPLKDNLEIASGKKMQLLAELLGALLATFLSLFNIPAWLFKILHSSLG